MGASITTAFITLILTFSLSLAAQTDNPKQVVLNNQVKKTVKTNYTIFQWGLLSFGGKINLNSSDQRTSELLTVNNGYYISGQYMKLLNQAYISSSLILGMSQARAQKIQGNIDYNYSDQLKPFIGVDIHYSSYLSRRAEISAGLTALYNFIQLPVKNSSNLNYNFNYGDLKNPIFISVGPTWRMFKNIKFNQKMMIPISSKLSSGWSLNFSYIF